MAKVDYTHPAWGMLHTHAAITADLGRFQARVRDGGELDRTTATLLAQWFDFFARYLHVHHESEDQDVFSELVLRDPSFAPAQAQLAEEHRELVTRLRAVETTLAELRDIADPERAAMSTRLGDQLQALNELLTEHLAHEETEVVDRLATHVSERDMKRIVSKMAKRTKLKDISMLLPWVLDSCPPEDLSHMRKQIPLPLRVLNKLIWQKRYDQLTAPLRELRRA